MSRATHAEFRFSPQDISLHPADWLIVLWVLSQDNVRHQAVLSLDDDGSDLRLADKGLEVPPSLFPDD